MSPMTGLVWFAAMAPAAAGVVFSGQIFCRTQIQSCGTNTCWMDDRQPRWSTHARPARKTGGDSDEVKMNFMDNMNIENTFVVYFMGKMEHYVQWILWLDSLDSYRLADSVFLVRGTDKVSLIAGLESKTSQTGAYFLCQLSSQPHRSGSAPAQQMFHQWLHRKWTWFHEDSFWLVLRFFLGRVAQRGFVAGFCFFYIFSFVLMGRLLVNLI